jgi:uncharacterized BrkB/YihY/UPF0761 family membrane protein
MLRALWHKFDRDWGWNLARLLAYTCLTALFAVLGLLLIILALVLRMGGSHLSQGVLTKIIHLTPTHAGASAVGAFESSLRHTALAILLLGILPALWYGSRFFVVMESCLCIIFQRPPRTFLAQNRAALLLLLLFTALLPAIVVCSTVGPALGFSTGSVSHGTDNIWLAGGPVLGLAGFVGGMAIDFGFLLVVFTRLTPGGVPWRAAVPGALLSAALAEGYLLIFPFYVRDILHPNQFGSIAGFVLVALVFIYTYALLIVIGAEVAAWCAGYRAAPRAFVATIAVARSEPSALHPGREHVMPAGVTPLYTDASAPEPLRLSEPDGETYLPDADRQRVSAGAD